MSKVYIIGLDGGTFKVIDYLIGKDRLPNFAEMLNGGSRATLLSTIPTITPAAWATFYTGMNPGRHGVVDFFKQQRGSYGMAPVNATTVKGEALWKQASTYGKRVCVFNVPVTYPAAAVNGIMISGMDAPRLDERAVHPGGFRDKLLKEFPGFRIEPDVNPLYLVRHHKDPVGECLRQFNAYLRLEIDVIEHLMTLEDWDLFVAVIRSTDAFQHLCWAGVEKLISGNEKSATDEEIAMAEAVFDCYEQLDQALGETWKKWGRNKNLIMMSDHGFCKLEREVCLNRILAGGGLLKFRQQPLAKRLKQRAIRYIAKCTPEQSRQKISRMRKGKDVDMWTGLRLIDWEHTKIYSKSPCLYVNFAGREPMGIINNEDERREVLREAVEVLRRFRDPEDKKPVFTEFYYRDDLYHGQRLAEMPDMVVGMREFAYRGISDTSVELLQNDIVRKPLLAFKQLAHTGDHHRDGMFIMSGPDIEHSDLNTIEMVDIAPTVMNLLGLPAKEEWDGKILSNAFSGGKTKEVMSGDVRETETAGEREDSEDEVYSGDDEQEIRKRLQDLGYL